MSAFDRVTRVYKAVNNFPETLRESETRAGADHPRTPRPAEPKGVKWPYHGVKGQTRKGYVKGPSHTDELRRQWQLKDGRCLGG